MSDLGINCRGCLWYVQLHRDGQPINSGECRRNPPVVSMWSYQGSCYKANGFSFPIVGPSFFCGEHQEK
jgi:hypothetical protein